jgi:hypothetical protein
MKKFILLILMFIGFVSCNDVEKTKRPRFQVVMYNTYSTWDRNMSHFDCDSIQFITNKEAFIWLDGSKMKIIAGHSIKVWRNN